MTFTIMLLYSYKYVFKRNSFESCLNLYGVGFVLVLNFHRVYSRVLQYCSIFIDLVFELFVKNCTLDLAASLAYIRFAFAFKILIT